MVEGSNEFDNTQNNNSKADNCNCIKESHIREESHMYQCNEDIIHKIQCIFPGTSD